MNPRRALLAIVSMALLATGVATARGGARPDGTVAAARLKTAHIGFYRNSLGDLMFYGEVSNAGPAKAGQVGVEVELFNKQGQRLARGVSLRVSRNVVNPGEKAVWTIGMDDNPKSWSRMKVTAVEQIGRDAAFAQDYRSFTPHGVAIKPENPGFSQKVTGTVVNTGKAPAKVAEVGIALYDAHGKLVYVTDQGFLYPYSSKQVVPPGKTAPFSAEILGYIKKPAKIVVYVRASTKDASGFYTD